MQTATSSSAPSATPNVNAPSAAAVVAAGVMSLASARSARRSVKKSVVSLRARGGEEDTRVCIPLEEILWACASLDVVNFLVTDSNFHEFPNFPRIFLDQTRKKPPNRRDISYISCLCFIPDLCNITPEVEWEEPENQLIPRKKSFSVSLKLPGIQGIAGTVTLGIEKSRKFWLPWPSIANHP